MVFLFLNTVRTVTDIDRVIMFVLLCCNNPGFDLIPYMGFPSTVLQVGQQNLYESADEKHQSNITGLFRGSLLWNTKINIFGPLVRIRKKY